MENRLVQDELSALRATAELRAVTDSIQDYAIVLLDPQGTVLTWNTGAREIEGDTAGEILGQGFERLYTAEDRTAGRPGTLLTEALRTGRAQDQGWRVRKDGSRFWADEVISAVNDGDGNLVGFTKVTRDQTERRREQEQLRQAEERLRLMIESVQDYAIFMLDREGRVATWNRGAQHIKGYSAQEIVGQHFSRFYPPDEISAGKPERELEVASSKGRFEEEGWRIRKDGSRFWANVVLSATRNRDGVLIGFTKITRDLSERKRAAEEMAERARQQSVAAELGLYALQTAQLAQVIERSMQTVRETLQIDDVRILRAGESAPPGARTVRIHAPEPGAEYGFLAASASS